MSAACLPGQLVMDEAAHRIGLDAPWRALASNSPRLHRALCNAGQLTSDFPRYPPGVRLIDAGLNAVLSAHFSESAALRDFQTSFRRLLDHVAQILFLEIRSGDSVWDPTRDPGLCTWREGREPLQQHRRAGLIPHFLEARDALAARLSADTGVSAMPDRPLVEAFGAP